MKINKYLKLCSNIYHTTLNPKGVGVARVHLIPPKKLKLGQPWVVIINGYYVLPLQTSWAILLKEFIIEINKTDGNEISDDIAKNILETVVTRVKAIYPGAKEKDIKKDLFDIVNTILDIARGKTPQVDIGFTSIAKYGKNMKGPHRMDLLVSSMQKGGCYNCNQKCLLCYAKDEKLAIVNELNTDCWYKIIDKCKEAGIPSLTFTGGEPTLREDLVDLISYASWFVTRLNTNGILLSKELCYRLYEANLDSVQVTLYSFDEEIHNKLVGTNTYRKTVEGIKNALDAGLDVSINTPLCNLNSNYLETVKFAHNLGVRYFSASGIIPAGNALNLDGIAKLSNEEITKVIDEAYKYISKNNLEIAFTSPGWIDKEELKKKNMDVPSCGACLSNMAIAPNGDVIPCQSWLHEDSLGNMLKNSFSSIWNNKKCKKIRKFAMKETLKCALKEGNYEKN